MFSRLSAVLVLSALFAAMPLAAQESSTTRGFVLGAGLTGVSLDPEDGETDSGGGLSIFFGYGFRSGLAVYLHGTAARMDPSEADVDEYMLGQGEIGVRYAFGSDAQRWRPYLAAAVGAVSVEWENVDFDEFGRVDVEISGLALTLGGGIQYFINPRWALDSNLLWSMGSFDEVKIDRTTVELEDKIKLNTFRFQLGFQYYFAGGKP